mgnify:CR=1 FL=1
MHHTATYSDVELITQLRLHTARCGDHEELRRVMLSSRFFAQAPEHSGFLACPTAAGPLIPVFTSLLRLARHAGAVGWFSTSGAELISLAPVGHRFVIDPGSSHEVVLDPDVFLTDHGRARSPVARKIPDGEGPDRGEASDRSL